MFELTTRTTISVTTISIYRFSTLFASQTTAKAQKIGERMNISDNVLHDGERRKKRWQTKSQDTKISIRILQHFFFLQQCTKTIETIQMS
jgi:ribosomal protein L28